MEFICFSIAISCAHGSSNATNTEKSDFDSLIFAENLLKDVLDDRFIADYKDSFVSLREIGMNADLPASIRGSALFQIASASENIIPSFAHDFTNVNFVPDENDISSVLLKKYNFLNNQKKMNRGNHIAADISEHGYLLTSVKHRHLHRKTAVEFYKLAAELGNPDAQFRMATLYSSGALGVKRDTEKAVVNYYFSALSGHLGASLAMGYRHSVGLGVPKSCTSAVLYYEIVANSAMRQIEAGGTGVLNDRERTDQDSKGAGYSPRNPRDEDEELVDYYKHAAEKGDVSAMVSLGKMYLYGMRGVICDHTRAAAFFHEAAASGDPAAQATLGHMLVNGMGVQKDIKSAFLNFTAAAESGSASGLNGLGYMHLYGQGVEKDEQKARELFSEAADSGNADAIYNLAAMYISDVDPRWRDYSKAIDYFSLAAYYGHSLAMHKMALMHLHGIGVEPDCNYALQLFKAVAECGEYVRSLARAYSFWNNDDDSDSALQIYLVASELGFEVAQANSAWLLDHGADIRGGVPLQDEETESRYSSMGGNDDLETRARIWNFFEKLFVSLRNFFPQLLLLNRAVNGGPFTGVSSSGSLRLYELAAGQGNVEARLRVGDFFYNGQDGSKTMDGKPVAPNFELAAYHYKKASDILNPQAKFNLGYMHQHGIGMERDLNLAKRYYDEAAMAHHDAKIPVMLAIAGMWIHSVYRTIVYQEFNDDLPYFVNLLAGLYRRFFIDKITDSNTEFSTSSGIKPTENNPDSVVEGDTRSSVMSSSSSFFDQWDMYLKSCLDSMESDTLLAVFLFVLLAIVLLIRSRAAHLLRRHEHND